MEKRIRWIFVLVAAVAVLGIANAGYLAWTALIGVPPTCNFIHGCAEVAASPYSTVLGVPLALFGVLFYVMIFGFAVWRIIIPDAPVLKYVFPLSALGFLLSLYFLYLQAFVIGAFCEYCLFSLFDATVLFIISTYLWMSRNKEGTIEKLEQS